MHLYELPLLFALIGLAFYTVLAGADFGAGWWQLTAGKGPDAASIRDHAHHAMGPVWEANHVWLIFVLTVVWTAYPSAFGSIASTLTIPLFIAAVGIIFRPPSALSPLGRVLGLVRLGRPDRRRLRDARACLVEAVRGLALHRRARRRRDHRRLGARAITGLPRGTDGPGGRGRPGHARGCDRRRARGSGDSLPLARAALPARARWRPRPWRKRRRPTDSGALSA